MINLKTFDRIEDKIDNISKSIVDKNYQLIKDVIAEEITYKENTFFDYSKLATAIYDIIYRHYISVPDIITDSSLIDDIIVEATIEGKYITPRNVKELRQWLQTKLLPEIQKEMVSPETDIKHKDKFITLVDKAISFHIDAGKEIQFLDTQELRYILYHFIFEQNASLTLMTQLDMITGIINGSLITDYDDKMSDEVFVTNLTKWLKYHVIPYIYENKRTYESKKNEEFKKEQPKPISSYELIPELKQIDYEIDINSKLYERISNIVRSFYESFYDKTSLCTYYTYYFLKLKGIIDFDYEFRLLENKLYTDFYNYGIFAILGELRHFLGQFMLKKVDYSTIDMNNYIDYPTYDKPQFTFRNGFSENVTEITKCVEISVEDVYKIIKIEMIYFYTNKRHHKSMIPDSKESLIIRDIEFLYLIEKHFGYLTKPELILKIALKAFNVTEKNNEQCYWSEAYGGEAWASITKTMLSRNFITSKTIFVDTCWSLQHNTQLFLDKVYNDGITELRDYLSEIKDGLFKNVYECAIESNPKLDRFIYRDIVLKNDTNVPNAHYKFIPEPQHGRFNYEESEAYLENRERREKLPEKEDVDITKYLDKNKYKLYEEIDGTWGLNTAQINNIQPFVRNNPHVELIIDQSPYRYITDLDSIMKYMNEKYPLSQKIKIT